MKNLRNILKQVIQEQLPNEPIALLFSGGTDSLTILWTLLDLGIKPTCYTFHLSYYESPDAKVSKREFFYQYSWAELNRPKQKMPPIISFQKEFRMLSVWF